MRLEAQTLREINLLKYYRLIRKWACKTNNLNDADLELLIYLDCKGHFTRNQFIDGTYTYSWDKNRWERLRKEGWIDVWRHRNRTTIKYTVYKLSLKAKHLIMRIYRIMLGEEDIPTSHRRNKIMKGNTYMDTVLKTAINNVNKDKDR